MAKSTALSSTRSSDMWRSRWCPSHRTRARWRGRLKRSRSAIPTTSCGAGRTVVLTLSSWARASLLTPGPALPAGTMAPSSAAPSYGLSWSSARAPRSATSWRRAGSGLHGIPPLTPQAQPRCCAGCCKVPIPPAHTVRTPPPQATRRCFTEEQIGAVMAGTLEGLIYLHRLNKIHRDIKAGPHAERTRLDGAAARQPGRLGLALQARGYATHSGRAAELARAQWEGCGAAVRPGPQGAA